jgi:hypothetical protein
MIDKYINKPGTGMFILLAPLDWGLGHATRCIPIIHSLQKYGAEVILAAEGATAILLKKEFPLLQVLPLKGYRVRYGASRQSFFLKLLSQVPSIQFTINQENKWLKELILTRTIHAVISDNRFGLYNKNIPSVYITHQLFLETGKSWLNTLAQNIHYRFIRNFNECWVPDYEGDQNNLAGKLSHPVKPPKVPVKYLGASSRFKKEEAIIVSDLLILLSGPEPQRTLFENQLFEQLKTNKRSVVLVRGLPAAQQIPFELPNVKIYNHLPAAQLSSAIQQSEWVLARAGYSTIMDLAALQQKAILVPTPGQGEQEYLASYLHQHQLCYSCLQDNFDLEAAIQNAAHFPFAAFPLKSALNDKVIHDWLVSVKKTQASQ